MGVRVSALVGVMTFSTLLGAEVAPPLPPVAISATPPASLRLSPVQQAAAPPVALVREPAFDADVPGAALPAFQPAGSAPPAGDEDEVPEFPAPDPFTGVTARVAEAIAPVEPEPPARAPGGGLASAAIVATAQSLLGVPYLWGGNTTGGMDCSAYVSRVWGLSHQTTDTLPAFSTAIAKDDLRTGDALNLTRAEDPRGYGHVRLFAGWANPQHTRLWVYEETPPRAVYHVIVYDPRYTPRRLNGAGALGPADGPPALGPLPSERPQTPPLEARNRAPQAPQAVAPSAKPNSQKPPKAQVTPTPKVSVTPTVPPPTPAVKPPQAPSPTLRPSLPAPPAPPKFTPPPPPPMPPKMATPPKATASPGAATATTEPGGTQAVSRGATRR